MTDSARAIEDQAIVLVGASGSGTSTVGRLLAVALGREHLDVDAVIAQRAVDVHPDDTEATLHERIKVVEREMLVDVLAAAARGRLHIEGRKVHLT